MIALTAYGIRKAYQKQQARRAHKELLEREIQDTTLTRQSDELPSIPTSSSYRQSADLHPHPVTHGLIDYSPSSPSSLNRAESASALTYSLSGYSQRNSKDPLEEMQQYRAYIQRQSQDLSNDTQPPPYEFVVGQDIEAPHPWKSRLNLRARIENPSEMQDTRHIPQGPNMVVELDTSSDSSRNTTQEEVPLRVPSPRSRIDGDDGIVVPATELPADIPGHAVSPISDDQIQGSLNEPVAEVPPPLSIRKFRETDRSELPVDEVTTAPRTDEGEHEEDHEEHSTEPERQQLKRARSESGSEIDSEDNEQVVVRFNVADRTKRQFPKRKLESD